MLKRIAAIFAGSAAHGAGGVVGVRAGNDAYTWMKSGEAKRTVKRIAGTMADAASAVLPPKEEPTLRDGEAAAVRPAQHRASGDERVQVECERCGRSAAVQLRSGDVIVTCATCTTRFWVDTDELAQRLRRA